VGTGDATHDGGAHVRGSLPSTCASCGAPVPADADRCERCSYRACSNCGGLLAPGVQECEACGWADRPSDRIGRADRQDSRWRLAIGITVLAVAAVAAAVVLLLG